MVESDWAMRSFRLLVVAVLAVLLAASSFSPVAANEEGVHFYKVTTNGDTTTRFYLDARGPLGCRVFGYLKAGSLLCGAGPYVIVEEVPPGWVLRVNCVSLEGSSFEYMPGQGVTITYTLGDFVECAFTNSPTGPVGGVVTPVNPVAVLAPWLAVIGAIAAVAVVIAAPWKKPEI